MEAPSVPQRWTERGWPAAAALLVAAAALAAYWNSLDVPLQFDDASSIVEDTRVHATALTPDQLGRAAWGFPLGRWLPYVTFAANHAVHGLRPLGYHAVNLAIHVTNALLVVLVSLELLGALRFQDDRAQRRTALLAGLLFAVHPVHTQAVTYVVQRMTSLGTSFALLCIGSWLVARRSAGARRRLLVAVAVVAAYLALACKENFVVLPLLVLFVEWVLDPALGARIRARQRAWLAALAAGAALAGWLGWTYAGVLAGEHARLGVPLADRVLSQGRVLFHYLSLLALPLPGRLHVDYAYAASTGLLSPPSTVLGLAGVAALVAATFWARTREPLVALGVGWFLVALSIEQTVFPIDLVFEHRLYFASIGLFLLAAASAVRFVRVPRLGAWAVAVPVIVALAASTHRRNEDWRNPIALYDDPVAIGPGRARSLFALGKYLEESNRLEEAARVLARAAELEPGDPSPYVNLGNIELDRGRPDEAERWYRTAIARARPHAETYYNLAIALERQGRRDEAMQAYETAVRLAPGHTDARASIARLQEEAGDLAGALATLDEAIARDPGSALALVNRALVLARLGRHAEAFRDASLAERLTGGSAMALGVLAKVHEAAGRSAPAKAAAEAALKLEPGNAEAREVLGLK